MPNPDSTPHYDVIVVGAGPTGLTAANIVSKAGHRVALFERHPTLYNLPRAGHVDNECLRILQGIGCLQELMQDAFLITRVPLLGADGQFLLELVPAVDFPSSFRSVMMYQPVLEHALYSQLKRHDDRVSLYLGWSVDSTVEQDNTTVRVCARPTTQKLTSTSASVPLTCSYLIAADGADSQIRGSLGIEREDFGISERWLDIDLAYRRPCSFGPPAIYGDPKRPLFFSPLGESHHRFECQLFPSEPTEEFSTPARAWELLAQRGITREDVEIVRQAVYTFEYRVAYRWHSGRVFLMGDAAHTMSPLLGQGMSSGIRDASNLGWKLDLVLRGRAPSSVLDSYATERRPHVKTWGDLSVKAGEFICITDPAKAAARDADVRRGGAPPLRPAPVLTTGLFDKNFRGSASVAGQMFPQRLVRRGAQIGLFDDVVGAGFLLLACKNPRPYIWIPEFVRSIDMRCLRLTRDATDTTAVFDETGFYEAFFEEHGLDALIVRPDHYVFGGAATLTGIGGLLQSLRAALSCQSAWRTDPLMTD